MADAGYTYYVDVASYPAGIAPVTSDEVGADIQYDSLGNPSVIARYPSATQEEEADAIPAPLNFVSRTVVPQDADRVLVCGSAQTATVNTGLPAGFGCLFKGDISTDGTATVNDVRVSGASDPWCALVNTDTDIYDLVGNKS